MALVKITEKEQTTVNTDASFLITQTGTVDGEEKEVLYRAALSDTAKALETEMLDGTDYKSLSEAISAIADSIGKISITVIGSATELQAVINANDWSAGSAYLAAADITDDFTEGKLAVMVSAAGSTTLSSVDDFLAQAILVGTGSGTVIISDLSEVEEPDTDTDYILNTSDGCLYYKYIDGAWTMVGGSSATYISVGDDQTIDDALASVSGSEAADYYVIKDSIYHHYRYIVTTDSEGNETGKWVCIGDTANLADSLSSLQSQVKTLDSSVEVNGNNIASLQTAISNMSSLVSDVKVENVAADLESGVEASVDMTLEFADGTTASRSFYVGASLDNMIMDEDGYLHLRDGDNNDIVDPVYIGTGGSGSTSSGSVTITRVMSQAGYCVYGESYAIEYYLEALDSGGDAAPNGTATWYVNGSSVGTSEAVNMSNNSFDIGDYLTTGTNTVKVSISVDTGGESNTVATKSWSVNAVNLYLTWNYSDAQINTSAITDYYTPHPSDISKTIYTYIDDVLYDTNTTTKSSEVGLVISKQSHGAHMVKRYMEATINDTPLETEAQYHDMIFVDSDNMTPIIAVSYDGSSVTQYNMLQLPIVAYDPLNETTTLELTVSSYDDDGNLVVESQTTWEDVDRTVNYWNYTPSTYGEKVLTITCTNSEATTTKTLNVTVDELDIDYEEVSGYAFKFKASDFTNNSDIRSWSSEGVTASFSDNFDWVNGGLKTETDDDGNLRQYVCVRSGTYMTIDYQPFSIANAVKQNGLAFNLTYKVTNCSDYDAEFLSCINDGVGIVMNAQSASLSSTGTTLTTQYVEDEVIEIGFDIRPYDSDANNTDRYMIAWIDGIPSRYKIYTTGSEDIFSQSTAQSIVIGSENCDVYVYMCKAYKKALSFEQRVQNFVMDAPNAYEMADRAERNDILVDDTQGQYDFFDIDYDKLSNVSEGLRIHLLKTSALPWAKGSDYAVKGGTYRQIYGEGDESHQIEADSVSIQMQGTSSVNYKMSAMNLDFKFTNGFTDGNGNSSDTYAMTDNSIGVNYFNCKTNVASCENANNACLADWYNTWQPYRTPYRLSNYKARDTMELHMGVLFIQDQNTVSDYTGSAAYNRYIPMYGDYFSSNRYYMYSIVNMGNSKKNSAVFHDPDNPFECCVEVLNNSDAQCRMVSADFEKEDFSGDYYYEMRYSSDDEAVEAMQQTAWLDFVAWMAECDPSAATGDALAEAVTFGTYTFKGAYTYRIDEDGDYYFDTDSLEYVTEEPDSPYTDEDGNIVKFTYAANSYTSGSDYNGMEILAGTTITEYAGEYKYDTKEYRIAKMLNECEDHMIMDAVVFHFLFIERFTMIDNVAKNTFWGSDDMVHWHLCKDYDNDTAMGNDNQGELSFTYGLETDDTIGSGNVFNAADSVWFVFVRSLYEARQTVFKALENVGAWSKTNLLAKMKEYQALIPERVWIQDYWMKYFRLYEWGQDSTLTYQPMLADGPKTYQRAQFNTYQEPYISSLYQGSVCTGDLIQFRSYNPSEWAGVEPGHSVMVKPYANGYIVWKAGNYVASVKAERGNWYTLDLAGDDDADFNNLETMGYCAGFIQGIDGLPALYIGTPDFNAAKRLTSLTIGSTEEGYSNANLGSLSLSGNTLLQELYVQNQVVSSDSENATLGVLDLSNLIQLRILDATGSPFSGFSFANNGMLEKAYLEAPQSITLRNLAYLTDFSMDASSLTTLYIEDCPSVDSLSIVKTALASGTLKRVRLIDIDWTFTDTATATTILDTLADSSSISGLDESGNVIEESVLTGTIYIPILYASKEAAYKEIWGDDLEITYGEYVNQFASNFYSDYDEDGNLTGLLGTHYIDEGSSDYAPVAAEEFDTPTKASDVESNYEFSHWLCVGGSDSYVGKTYEDSSDASWPNPVSKDMTYVAVYSATPVEYTVTYKNTITGDTFVIKNVKYGSEVVYNYDEKTVSVFFDGEETVYEGAFGYPTASVVGTTHYLFKGWDKWTGKIVGDITVSTLWETTSGDMSKADTTEWSWAELKKLIESYSDNISEYVEGGDKFLLKMGNDFSFDNVEEIDIVSEETHFDGETAFKVMEDEENAVQLFNADFSFTLAIDLTMSGISSTNVALSCGSLKLRTYYISGSYYPQIYVADGVNNNLGFGTQRNIIVFRHTAGSETLYAYVFNTNTISSGYSDDVTIYEYEYSEFADSDKPLCIGNYIDSSTGEFNSSTYYKGVIHWCKLWKEDLGDGLTQEIAKWTRETHSVKLSVNSSNTFERYPLASDSDENPTNYAPLSFAFDNELSSGYKMNTSNTNVGGWDSCLMRQFLNPASDYCESGFGRFWNGLPYGLRSLIVPVQTAASPGNMSTSVKISRDYIYLRSYQENNASTLTTEPYQYEGSYYNIFKGSDNRFKIRFRGLIIPEDATYYAASTSSNALSCEVKLTSAAVDPTSTTNGYSGQVKEGDIWINSGNSSIGYYYVTNETYEKYALGTGYWATSNYAIQAEDESGYWLFAAYWWERSAFVSNAAYFLYVSTYGNANGYNGANVVYGVCPGFSIGID